MALTVNQAKKEFRAGKTFWRCLPCADGGVWIQEVCLQGKIKIPKQGHSKGTPRVLGAKRDRYSQGEYYLTDLCGWGIAKAFNSRRKALKFKEDYAAGKYPELQDKVIEREEENRRWSFHFD